MQYCEKCRTLCESTCETHKKKYLRQPEGNDPIFLAQLSGFPSAMLEGILLDEKVPFLKEGRMGAGMSVWVGSMMEQYSFYVPFMIYDQAKDLYALVSGDQMQTDDGIDIEDI